MSDRQKKGFFSRARDFFLGAPKEPEGYDKAKEKAKKAEAQASSSSSSDSTIVSNMTYQQSETVRLILEMNHMSSFMIFGRRLDVLDLESSLRVLEELDCLVSRSDTEIDRMLIIYAAIVLRLDVQCSVVRQRELTQFERRVWDRLSSHFSTGFSSNAFMNIMDKADYSWRGGLTTQLLKAAEAHSFEHPWPPELLALFFVLALAYDMSGGYYTSAKELPTTYNFVRTIGPKLPLQGLYAQLLPFIPYLKNVYANRFRSVKSGSKDMMEAIFILVRSDRTVDMAKALAYLFLQIAGENPTPESIHALGQKAAEIFSYHKNEVIDYLLLFVNLAHRKGAEPMFLPSIFKNAAQPLLKHLLDSPPPSNESLLVDAYMMLPMHAPSIDWPNIIWDCLKDTPQWTDELVSRVPPEFQPRLRDAVVPLAGSKLSVSLFGASSPREQLVHLSKHAYFKKTHRPFIHSLFEILSENDDLFQGHQWNLLEVFNNEHYEQLFTSVFTKLSSITDSLHDIQNFLHKHSGILNPQMLIVVSILVKKTVQRWPASQFVSSFNEIVGRLADPGQKSHVPPGIVSLFAAHYLLQGLNDFTQDATQLLKTGLYKLIPFLKWYNAICQVKDPQSELKLLLQASTPLHTAFRSRIVDFFLSLENQHITMEQVQCIIQHKDRVQELQHHWKLENIEEQTRVAYIMGQSLINHVDQACAFKEWFDEVKVDTQVVSVKKDQVAQLTISQLRTIVDKFKSHLLESGFELELIDCLHSFLLPQRSEIFSLVFKKVRAQHAGKITPTTLSKLVQESCLYLQQLFSDDSRLSNLEQVWKIADQVGPTKLQKELEQLGEIVKRSKDSTIKISELRSQIESGAKLRAYSDSIPGLLSFFDALPVIGASGLTQFNQLPLESLDRIERVRKAASLLTDLPQLQVRELSGRLKTVRVAVGGLEPHTIRFFGTLVEHIDLIRFCHRPDFRNKMDILTGQIQGMAFANELLTSLSDVHSMLTPILNFETIDRLFLAVHGRIGAISTEQLSIKLKKFDTCRNHINELRIYFTGSAGDSAATFLPTAMRSLERGRFLIRSSLHQSVHAVVLQQFRKEDPEVQTETYNDERDEDEEVNPGGRELETSLEGHNLHGRLRGMTVFLDRSSLKEEEIDALTAFNECYFLANEIGAQFERLVLSGHPAFQTRTFAVGNGDADMTVDKYRFILNSLKISASSWEHSVASVSKESPRLLFLDPKAIAALLRALKLCLQPNVECFFMLTPYLLRCFPEIHRPSKPVPFTKVLIEDLFFGGKFESLSKIAHNQDEEELFNALLQHSGYILKSLEQDETVADLIEESGEVNLAKPRVVKAVGMQPVDLFKASTQICERIPHASQILHCSKSLTSMDLTRFLKCSKRFPRLVFIVSGVNLLSHELRQQLLSWTSRVACRPQATHGAVVLLFTSERSGEDMFGFLHTESANNLGFEFTEKAVSVLHARNIASFHCLHSRQGKTTSAQQHLKAFKPTVTLTLSFAESFSPSIVQAALSDLKLANDAVVGLHIDIKPYTSLESVSRFLTEWLYFGVLYDPLTGEASWPSIDMGRVQWHIVVELSSPLPGDRDFGHLVPSAQNSTPPILNHLPAVYNLMTRGNPLPSPRLEITSRMRLVAGLISTWNEPNFTQDLNVGSALTNDQVQQVFDAQWKHIGCLRRRHAIIELLCHSCFDFMRLYAVLNAKYCDLYIITLQQYRDHAAVHSLLRKKSGAKELFRMLLAEAEYLTDTSKSATPVPLIIRHQVPDVQGYLKNEDLMALALQKTVWEAIYFGPPDPTLEAKCPLPLIYFNRETAAIDRSNQRMRLRVTLANALGLENTAKMRNTIDMKSYVLTSNLANKMLHLHARRLSGNNIILVGDTGQGKTEMVDFYSLFLNMDSSEIPDLLEEMAQLALRFIDNMYHVKLPFKLPAQRTRTNVIQLFTEIAVSERPQQLQAPSSVASIFDDAASSSNPAPLPQHMPTQQDLTKAQGDTDNRSCWPDLRETLKVWLARMLNQYPLLMPTPEIEELLPTVEDDEEPQHPEADADEFEDDEQNYAVLPLGGIDFLGDDRGEVWRRDDFESILGKIMAIRTQDLFHKQLMYKGLTLEAFSDKLQEVRDAAERWPHLKVLFFIDEANTTSFMGRLKELMVDRRWQDQPLPENIFLVAAVNPLEIDRAEGLDGVTMSRVDYSKHTNIETVVKSTSTFDVRLPHPSMNELEYHFETMDEKADDDFWEAMVELPGSEIFEAEKRTVIEYVLLGHQQIRLALIENMHPSIRDLVRALKLFKYFRRSTLGSVLLQEISLEEANPMHATIPKTDDKPFSKHFWKALFMTVAVGYYLRLRTVESSANPDSASRAAPRDSRLALLQVINRKYDYDNRRHPDVDFINTLQNALMFLFQHTQIPSGIAATLALMENLFCTVICTDMRMPLTISGPAGCSKTLSFSIALDNMRGIGSTKPLFKFCQQMHHFRYQCSPMSSDAEIDSVYNEASSRQAGLAEAAGVDIREICTVLLDELNLAEKGTSQPLKVIHGKLDHPKVMTVILTNKLLDPAKTNRTLQVQQSVPTPDDLHALASSCLFDAEKLSDTEFAIVEGSVKAYRIIEQRKDLGLSFQLRDFVYFLRSLRTSCRSANGSFQLTPALLINSILRNFGGLIETEKQTLVVQTFFDTINQQLQPTGSPKLVAPALPATPTAILRESIGDVIPLLEMNPNVNSSRYLLVLDPTDSCTAVNLLFDMEIANRERTTVIACSEFEEDASESGINERVMLMKDSMARGDTVVLVAADGIFGNFYDLFNKYFSIVPTDSVENGQPQVTFFANVAVGSISRPCRVHPQFKVIVHLPISQLPNTPLPFLSRFEKFVLSMDHCLVEKIQSSGLISPRSPLGHTQMDALIAGVSDFAATVQQKLPGQYPFHGFADSQTILSLAMSTLDSSPHGTILDHVPLPRFIRSSGADDTPAAPARSEVSANWVKYVVRMTNFRLLQLARTDAACQMRFLPQEYLKEYFLRQEHLSASNLIREIMRLSHEPIGTSLCRKWVVSTRSSGELSRLHSDAELQSHIIDKTIGTLRYLSLSSVNSLAKINVELGAFMESGSEGLVICADMRTSSASQINDLRRAIDNHLRGIEEHPHVFVILHHPPEHSQSPQSAYPAIFWNRWDFYHTDSLGLMSTRNDEIVDIVDEQASQTVYRVDAREWIAKSAGLDVEVSLDSVKQLFADHFETEFKSVLRLVHLPPDKNFARLKHARNVYLDKSKRASEIIAIIQAEQWIAHNILSQFAKHWTDALLHKIVQGTSTAIKDGKTAGGYVPLIRNSLRFMLTCVCKDIISSLLSNYNMESMLVMTKEQADPATEDLAALKKEFVFRAISVIPPPSLETILASSSLDERVAKDESVFHIKMGKGIVTQLPLFDVVAQVLKDSVAKAMSEAGISSIHENIDRFVYTFSKDLRESEELEDLLQLIDSNTDIQELFLNDFIHHQLGIPHLPPHLLIIVRTMLLSQAHSMRDKVSIMPAALFILAPSIRNALAHAGLCLVPLSSLEVGINDVESSYEEKENADAVEMEVGVHTFSLTLLWKTLTNDDGNTTENLWGWFLAMRDLHTRITSARLQRSCQGNLKQWYYRMLLLFQTITSFELDPKELRQLVELDVAAGFNGLFKAEIEDLRSSLLKIEHMSRLVARTRSGEAPIDEEMIVEGARRLVQSVISTGISFDSQVHDTTRSGRVLCENLRLFLKMVADTSKDIPKELSTLITPQWTLSQLAGLASTMVHLPTMEWFNELRKLSSEAIKDSNILHSGQYAPFVPFLTSEDTIIRHGKFVQIGTNEPTIPVRTLVQPHDLPYHPLQVIWFTIFSSLHKSLGSWNEHETLYERLAFSDAVGHVERVSCVVSMIQLISNALSSEKSLAESRSWIRNALDFAREVIFKPSDLRRCLERGLPADPVPYFMTISKSTDVIQDILATEELLERLGLRDWLVENKDSKDSRIFRWMNLNDPIDHRYEMHKQICAQLAKDSSVTGVDNLVAVMDSFILGKEASSIPFIVFDLRMVLIMAIFQKFMSQGVACDVIRLNLTENSSLTRKLDLVSDLERKAFLYMSSGPHLQVAPENEVEQHFSQAAFDELGSLGDEALMLAISLATTLGMPRDSNHMYTLVFNSTSISRHTKMPGSTYKCHADCGFKADFTPGAPILDSAPGILGNVSRHRLAFNASYWSAFCWAIILDPAKTAAHAVNPEAHVLNVLSRRTPEEALNDIFRRAYRFTMALDTETVDGKSLEPIQYFTETLQQLQTCVNAPAASRGPAWKSVYASDADLDAYHKAFQSQVSMPVDASLEPRKKTYFDSIAKADAKLAYLVEIRTLPATEFGVVLPSSASVASWISQTRLDLSESIKKLEQEDPARDQIESEISLLDFIDDFLGMQVHLVANRLIPSFVQYLEALSSVFDGRLTTEELTSVSIEKAFEILLERNLESEIVVSRLTQLTYDFSENSKLFKMLVPILDGCPDGLRNREFEYEVTEIDPKETKLGLLLGLSIDGLGSSNADRIRSMIKNLVDRHNVCLSERNKLSRINGWNKNQSLYNDSSKMVVPLSALQQNSTSHTEQNFAIITGDIPLATSSDQQIMIPLCSPILGLITSFTNPSRKEVDWRRTAERIAMIYTGGRHELMAMPELQVRPIDPSRAKQNNQLAQDNTAFLHLDYYADLERVAEEFKDLCGPTFRHYEERHQWKSHLRFNANELQSLCKHIYLIISALLKKYEPINAFPEDVKKSLMELERDACLRPLQFSRREIIFSKSGFFLYHLAMFLVELSNEYGFWYIEEDRAAFEADLSEESSASFKAIMAELPQMDSHQLKPFHEDLLQIQSRLASEQTLRSAQIREVQDPLRRLVEDFKDLNAQLVLRLLPDSIGIAHFTTFLRKLQVMIQESAKLMKNAVPEATATDLYEELVPERYVEMGISNARDEFVPAPDQYVLPSGERMFGEDWRIDGDEFRVPTRTVDTYFFQQMANLKLDDVNRLAASAALGASSSTAQPVLSNPALAAAYKQNALERSMRQESPSASSVTASSSPGAPSSPYASNPSQPTTSIPLPFSLDLNTPPHGSPAPLQFPISSSPIMPHPAMSALSAATSSAQPITAKQNPLAMVQESPSGPSLLYFSSHLDSPESVQVQTVSSHSSFDSHTSSTSASSTQSRLSAGAQSYPMGSPFSLPQSYTSFPSVVTPDQLPSLPEPNMNYSYPGMISYHTPYHMVPPIAYNNPHVQAGFQPSHFASYAFPHPAVQSPTSSTGSSQLASSSSPSLTASQSLTSSSSQVQQPTTPKEIFLQKWRADNKSDKPATLAKSLKHSTNRATMARQGSYMYTSKMTEWMRSEEKWMEKDLDDEKRTFLHLSLQLGNATMTSTIVENQHQHDLLSEMVNRPMASSSETPAQLANRMILESMAHDVGMLISLELCIEFRLIEILMASAIPEYIETFAKLCIFLGDHCRPRMDEHLGNISSFSDRYDEDLNYLWPE